MSSRVLASHTLDDGTVVRAVELSEGDHPGSTDVESAAPGYFVQVMEVGGRVARQHRMLDERMAVLMVQRAVGG